MVNGMKTLQKRHFVQSQMNEVLSNVRDDHGQKELQQPRQAGNQLLKNRNTQVFSGQGGRQQNEKRQNLDWKVGGHKINQILGPVFSKCALLRVLRPDSFEW